MLLDIQRQPGANIIETVERVKKILPRLTASLPAGIHLSIFSDRTETIRASVRDVQFTLVLTIGLVVLVLLYVSAASARHDHPERGFAAFAAWVLLR